MCNNLNVDIVNINALTKIGKIIAMCSQDIEWKRYLISIKGHLTSVTNLQKVMCKNPNVDLVLVNINAYT